MNILEKLKNTLKKKDTTVYEKPQDTQKTIETNIRPVKIPTLLDLGGKLQMIFNDVEHIKQEMVSKAWFRAEYDEGEEIIKKLEVIEQKLNDLQKITPQLNDLSNKLSYLPKEHRITINRIKETEISNQAKKLLDTVTQKKKVNYTELKNFVGMSDPTISKYLKQLLKQNKIEKEKVGRFAYYSTLSSSTRPERVSQE